MAEKQLPSAPSFSARTMMLASAGVLFAAIWIAAHCIWVILSLTGSVMANDSGAASAERHGLLIGGMLGGQILAGSAGIPGGLAFFRCRQRKKLLWTFSVLFASGVLIQLLAFLSFFHRAS